MNPFKSESLLKWIPSKVNPFKSESLQKWVPSKVNPLKSEFPSTANPFKSESLQYWIPSKVNPFRSSEGICVWWNSLLKRFVSKGIQVWKDSFLKGLGIHIEGICSEGQKRWDIFWQPIFSFSVFPLLSTLTCTPIEAVLERPLVALLAAFFSRNADG